MPTDTDMAAEPLKPKSTPTNCHLRPFAAVHADRVLSWITSDREAYWLAPRARPPLVASDVLHWQTPGHQPYLLIASEAEPPVGYGELNLLSAATAQYWLGHLIVDPEWRRRGLGLQLTRLLLWHAFFREGAREVSLVVFQENEAALACYRAAGMHFSGYELHVFPAYGTEEQLARLAISRADFLNV